MAERDLTQLSAVKGLAGWIGKESDALVVMVLRGEDCAFWVAPDVKPEAAIDAVEAAFPELLQVVRAEREEARAKAAEKERKRLERELREKR